MNQPLVRPARESDIEHLPPIERAAATLFPLERLPVLGWVPTDVLQHGREQGLLWVADENETPVGFCLAEQYDDDLHVVEIDVYPDYGGRGTGRRLMHTLIDEARRRQCQRVTLTTFDDMPWNRPFYQRLGFNVIKAGSGEARLSAQLAKEREAGYTQRVAMVLAL